MGLVKASIAIPEDIFKRAKKLSDNFSSLVTEALKEYFRKANIQKAKKSFGSWEDRKEDSISIVNKIRSDKGRNYASRND